MDDIDESGCEVSGKRFQVTKAACATAVASANPPTDDAQEDDNDVTDTIGSSVSGKGAGILKTRNKAMFAANALDLYQADDHTAADKTVQHYLHATQHSAFGHKEEYAEPKEKANLGVILGVFFPCIQNIFGVIYFVRLYWIVGEAGSVEAFFIVFSCCCVSILTSLSISAIATNGRVTGGGTYFMISRSLGPEFGGAVGILFYLGISVSVAMYLAGSIELLLVYIVPEMSVFSDKYSDARLYGTLLLMLVAATVFVGVKFVSKVAMLVLSSVLIAIVSVYIGMFVASPDNSSKVCFLGERLLASKHLMENGTLQCTKEPSGPLYRRMCNNATCDPYFLANPVHLEAAVPGLTYDNFAANAFNKYGDNDQVIGTDVDVGDVDDVFITRDISTSFVVLLAIYFPSITGFEQGSSYSGDLADAQKSIPLGTLWAVAVTSTVYLSTVLLFSATVDGSVLRDKFGQSIDSKLIMSQLSWPSPWVILIGALMSTVGAGLQALTAAPRLLQAIAKDDVFPILRRFQYMTRKGEPIPAIALSVCIAEIGIIIANLDYVAPIVTMFFLICYGFVNFACALQDLLRSPHWRPRFRFYHWTLALLGVALCLTLMIMSSWYYTLIALFLACSVYKYVEYKGAEKEWGDGMKGLAMSAARFALLRLKQDAFEGSTKNWRPQLLVLTKLNKDKEPMYPRMLSIASQLKAGMGLTIAGSVIPGQFSTHAKEAKEAKIKLSMSMEQEGVKGFVAVMVSQDVSQGLCNVIQSAGLGALKPNTVMLAWPDHWFDHTKRDTYNCFIESLQNAQSANMGLLVVKGSLRFPSNSDRLEGNIDIWWVMHDGSMLIMLAFLLAQHKVWRNCKIRLFTVAQMEDNSVQIKNDLTQYMYNLRIPATVEVVEMEDKDISAYIYERTLKMEERLQLLTDLHLKQKETKKVVDTVVHRAHKMSMDGHRLSVALGIETSKMETDVPKTETRDVKDVFVEIERSKRASLSNQLSEVYYTFSPEMGLKSRKESAPGRKDSLSLAAHRPSLHLAIEDEFEGEELEPLMMKKNAKSKTAPTKTPSGSCLASGSTSAAAGKVAPKKTVAIQEPPSSQPPPPSPTNNSSEVDMGEEEDEEEDATRTKNMRKMHTAIRLNEFLKDRSSDSQLIILNLPSIPNNPSSQGNYMHFLEILVEGLDRILMIRGSGQEVITMYS